MVQLIPTLLEYLSWLLQHSVTVQMLQDVSRNQLGVTINAQPATPAAPTAAATCNNVAVATGTITVICSDWRRNHL
jgi:hypothetical protein